MHIDKLTGRLPSGEKKYKKIKYRGTLWKEVSKYVRNRDGKCLQCGSIKKLQADHFHPTCYLWRKSFFDSNKIQTLCKKCHDFMPKKDARWKDGQWKKYIYFSK